MDGASTSKSVEYIDLKGVLYSEWWRVEEIGVWGLEEEFINALPRTGLRVQPEDIRATVLSLVPLPPATVIVQTSPLHVEQWLGLPSWVRLLVDGVEVKERVRREVQELIWGGLSKKDAKALYKSPPKTDKTGKLTRLYEAQCAVEEWPDTYTYIPPMFTLPPSLLPNVVLVALDFETNAKWKFKCEISGLAVSRGDNGERFWYVDEGDAQRVWDSVVSLARPVFHGGNYDLAVAKSRGWSIPDEYDDTILMAFSGGEKWNDESRSLGLKVLAKKYLNREMREMSDFIGDTEFKRNGTMNADPLLLAEYAMEDVHATLDLLPILRERMHRPTYNLEMKLAPIVLGMDEAGFNADERVLEGLVKSANVGMFRIERWMGEMCGWTGNLNSSDQVSPLLYKQLGLESQYGKSTSKEAMAELSWHPVPKRIRAWRRLESLGQEAQDLLDQQHEDGRMHTTFFQYGASTGRFSSGDPINLQNKRNTIRKAFIPDDVDREVVYRADYAQIELRVAAYLSQDEAMLRAIKDGESLHRNLLKLIKEFGVLWVTYDEVKKFDFTLFYGGDVQRVQEALKSDASTAKTVMGAVEAAWPRAMAWRGEVVAEAKANGNFNTSIRGRPYYYPDLDSDDFSLRSHAERTVVNKPVQGSSADVLKLAMCEVPGLHRKYGGKMRITQHDEVAGTVPKESRGEFMRDLRVVMLEAAPQIPLDVEIAVGSNWAAAKPK